MYHLYTVQCADGTLYTGITTNLKRRIAEHNNSRRGAKYTRSRRPITLLAAKKFRNRSTATKAEHKLKILARAEKLKAIAGW